MELSAFNVGLLSPDRLEIISAHLRECRACESALANLDDVEDRLIAELRQPIEADPFSDEERERIVAIVEAVALEPSRTNTDVPRSTVSAASAEEATASLLESGWSRRLGQYELLEKLGRGGMGTVYKARHVKLGKLVALKVLTVERISDPAAIARFHREMRAVGHLNHPNIVQATDAGEADGYPYLVMELVDGIDLSRLVQRLGPLPVPDACELVRQAAVGLQHAHTHGMVHRDIKPSNLMLTGVRSQVSVVSNKPGAASTLPPESCPLTPVLKILDLGLALLRAESPTAEELTATGQIIGTRDYMAPEQFDASHTVDIRADIYSLGATLFKLLTGQPPGRHGRSAAQAATAAADSFRPSSFVQALRAAHGVRGVSDFPADMPADVLVALDRMLAANPADRFQTPAAVAAALAPYARDSDLSQLVSSEPRSVKTAALECVPHSGDQSPSSRSQPKARLPILLGTSLFILAIAVMIGFVAVRWSGGQRSLDESALRRISETARFVGHTDAVRFVAFSPDGRTVISAGYDKTIRLWDAETSQQIHAFTGHTGRVIGVALSSDARQLLSVGEDHNSRLWDTETHEELRRLSGHPSGVTAAVFAPGESGEPSIITADRDGIIRFWSLDATEPTRQFSLGFPAFYATFSPDARQFLFSGGGKQVRACDLDSGRVTKVLSGHTDKVRCVAFSPDRQTIASGSDDRTVRLWDPASGKQLRCLIGHTAPVLAVAFSPDGHFILSGDSASSVRLWNSDSGRAIALLEGHTDSVRCVAFSPDDRRAATGSNHNTARMWELPR